MDVNFQSDKISLRVQFEHGHIEEELWQTFRKTAVEPSQTSSSDLATFVDECLLCAQIVANMPLAADDGAQDGLQWDADGYPRDSGSAQLTCGTEPADPLPHAIPESRKAGLVYLHTSEANPVGEANVGVILKRDMQGHGYAREAIRLVLRWAFEELHFHRVQVAVLDTPFKDKALRLLIGSGFAHEGTKRRAVYQPEGEGMAGVWKDVTYLAILDTEWMLRSTMGRCSGAAEERPAVSVWEEMFIRHSREREELLQWEEKHGRASRRSTSVETLRENMRRERQDTAYLTDDTARSSVGDQVSVKDSLPPFPKPNLVVTRDEDTHMEDVLDQHETEGNRQPWDHVVEASFAARRGLGEGYSSFLDLSPPRGPTLALPSIPSIRLSEGNPQSPVTIPSPTSTPPFSPSPVPSSVCSSWPDSEHEDNWAHEGAGDPTPSNSDDDASSIEFATPHEISSSAKSRSISRSDSVSSSSSDAWSDAHSSTWDLISDSSDRDDHGRF